MAHHRLPRVARFVLGAALALASLGAPASAAASCAVPPGGGNPIDTSDAVFLGTVTAIANGGRWATVHVEEVWKGPDQPADVVVRGGPEGDMATSVDRSYLMGTRYLFAVALVDGTLQDSACSGTVEAGSIDLEAMRPADVRTPEAAPVSGGGIDLGALIGPILVVALVGGLLIVTVLLARRREA